MKCSHLYFSVCVEQLLRSLLVGSVLCFTFQVVFSFFFAVAFTVIMDVLADVNS